MRKFVAFALLLGAVFVTRPAAAATIDIDLSAQRMHVTAANGDTRDWPISSARSGFSTPRGYYKPTSLQVMHYSRKYDMAPMQHSIFFHGGYAIHGTTSIAQLGRPASHGCIRLAPGNASLLFAMVQREGARISISGAPPRGGAMVASERPRQRAISYAPTPRRAAPQRMWYFDPGYDGDPYERSYR